MQSNAVYDPFRDGGASEGMCRWQFSAEAPYAVRATELQAGDVVIIDGVRVQAMPYSLGLNPGGTPRPLSSLANPDEGCTAVVAGTMVVENIRTGRREILTPDQTVETTEAPAPQRWSGADHLAYGTSLIGDPAHRYEAFAHLHRAIAAGGDAATAAHLALARWQGKGMWSAPLASTADAVAPNVIREITAHLVAAVRAGGRARDEAAQIAAELGGAMGWDRTAVDLVTSLSRAAGDAGAWGPALLCRAATVVAPQDRAIAREWVAAGLRSADASVRAEAIQACRAILDLSRESGDAVTIDRLQGAVEASRTLTEAERAQLSAEVSTADRTLYDSDLDALLATLPGRLTNRWDALRAHDVDALVAAGGRWRDGVVRAVVAALTESLDRRQRTVLALPGLGSRYPAELRQALDAAIAAADAARDTVTADAYGAAFAQTLGDRAGMDSFGYAVRGLGSRHDGVRRASLAVIRGLVDRGVFRRDPATLQAQFSGLTTPEAAEAWRLLTGPATETTGTRVPRPALAAAQAAFTPAQVADAIASSEAALPQGGYAARLAFRTSPRTP